MHAGHRERAKGLTGHPRQLEVERCFRMVQSMPDQLPSQPRPEGTMLVGDGGFHRKSLARRARGQGGLYPGVINRSMVGGTAGCAGLASERAPRPAGPAVR